MRKLFNSTAGRPIKTLLIVSLMFTGFLFTACKNYDKGKSQKNIEERAGGNNRINTEADIAHFRGFHSQTLSELQHVHSATAKYQDINNAFGDSYVDIGLVMPDMSYHLLKREIISPVFDLRKPPILVYSKKSNGKFELVSVEYTVPINSQSLNTPPEGFAANAGFWDFNTLNIGW